MVHPHVCGADGCGVAHACHDVRFIPTCVGQILPPLIPTVTPPVHPHVRGADALGHMQEYCNTGSSPRAWGRCFVPMLYSFTWMRFIPTYVGQMAQRHHQGSKLGRFIPTFVGQMADVLPTIITCNGSSPRAWGRYIVGVLNCRVHRFIPTCVGQMGQRADGAGHDERFIPTCVGQIPLTPPALLIKCGSSPRAWGRCSTPGSPGRSRPVHPHVRGADPGLLLRL